MIKRSNRHKSIITVNKIRELRNKSPQTNDYSTTYFSLKEEQQPCRRKKILKGGDWVHGKNPSRGVTELRCDHTGFLASGLL